MTARMAGAIVAVVLVAAPGLAAAEDTLPMLWPDTADEGASEAVAAPADGEGSVGGGVPAEVVPAEVVAAGAVPAQAAAGDTRAGDTRAGDEGTAAVRDASDEGSTGPAETSQEPVSRLLQALAEAGERPGTPKTPTSPDDGAAGALRVHAAEGCPRSLLRRLLAGAADDAGALTALGIEREVLSLCRERQEVVAGLFETEARLRELREAARGPKPVPEAPAAALRPAPVPVTEAFPAAPPAGPSPLRAALAAPAGTEEEAAPSTARVPPPSYGWFSIIGTAGALRAGVTDGTGVWFVREGDALPGGSVVTAIAGRPPAVRVSGTLGSKTGEEIALSWRARPEGAP